MSGVFDTTDYHRGQDTVRTTKGSHLPRPLCCCRIRRTPRCNLLLVPPLPARLPACPHHKKKRFVLVAVELAFSFAMGVSCLIFSVNLVRKLREEDQPPYHIGGGGGGGSSEHTGPSVGLVGTNKEEYSRLTENGDGEGGGGEGEEEEEGRRRPRSGPAGLAPATTAAEFARTRGIGSLLSRNAGSRLDRYYDDSDDEYWEASTAVAMTTSNGRRPRGDAGVCCTGGGGGSWNSFKVAVLWGCETACTRIACTRELSSRLSGWDVPVLVL